MCIIIWSVVYIIIFLSMHFGRFVSSYFHRLESHRTRRSWARLWLFGRLCRCVCHCDILWLCLRVARWDLWWWCFRCRSSGGINNLDPLLCLPPLWFHHWRLFFSIGWIARLVAFTSWAAQCGGRSTGCMSGSAEVVNTWQSTRSLTVRWNDITSWYRPVWHSFVLAGPSLPECRWTSSSWRSLVHMRRGCFIRVDCLGWRPFSMSRTFAGARIHALPSGIDCLKPTHGPDRRQFVHVDRCTFRSRFWSVFIERVATFPTTQVR